MRYPTPALLFFGLLLAISSAACGQEPDMESLRKALRLDKATLVDMAMNLSDEDAALFEPIYGDYETELVRINDRRLQLVERYAQSYSRMTDQEAKELTRQWFAVQKDRLKLKKKFHKRIAKALSATTAARFLQVEHQIGLLGELQLAAEMPLIQAFGE